MWCPSTASAEISLPHRKKVIAKPKTKVNSPIILKLDEDDSIFTSGFINITAKKSNPHNATDAMMGV